MPQVSQVGKVVSVKVFDDDMKAEILLETGSLGTIKLKLTDNHQSAFSGMVALASIAFFTYHGSGQCFVTYDEDDMEISQMELRSKFRATTEEIFEGRIEKGKAR